MRMVVLAGLVCALAASSAYAQSSTCKAQAAERGSRARRSTAS